MKKIYGLCAVDPTTNDIVHRCMYLRKPNQSDTDHLVDELRTDPEFVPLLEDIDWFVRPMTDAEVNWLEQQIPNLRDILE